MLNLPLQHFDVIAQEVHEVLIPYGHHGPQVH